MKNIVEGDLQNHQLKPQDISTVVPELQARSIFGKIYRGAKKAAGAVSRVIATARKYVATAGKIFNTAQNVAGTVGKMSARFLDSSVGFF